MIGKILNDKYRIESLIGTGGMAKVYKAVNIATGEPVAIKFLKEENQQNASYVRRFEHEAQAGMALNHPNIVKLLDAGVFEGQNYIVFEFVNGPTLKDYIVKHGVFSPRSAVNIVGHILDAIGYAHAQGIIHRDVKPQNVMITANGTVKLADFGIARLVNASTKSFSGTGAMGSVHYISPEQAEGKEVTFQTDLYSVGIILYEMLTGEVPFDNENEVSVAVMHVTDKVNAPNVKNPQVSHALNSVVLKATAKDMSKRYQSAADMKNDLLRALHEPDGTFADMPEEEETDDNNDNDENAKKTQKTILGLNTGVFTVLVTLVSLLIIMVAAFMIIRSAYNPTVVVPSLVDKTEEEARKILGTSFNMVVKKESSNVNPGFIISQDPASGKRIAKGSTITVVVCIGDDLVVAPGLNGRNLADANQILQKNGLVIGSVVYDPSSDAQEGTVFKQSPEADKEVAIGTAFTVYISGTPEKTAKVPNVTDMSIKKAVEKLNKEGFMHIFVRLTAEGGKKENYVYAQGLDEGLTVDIETPVFITVYYTKVGAARYDGAANITLEHDSNVLVTIDSKQGYEIIVFEGVKQSGTSVLSFTAHMEESGEYTCIIYVNNTFYKDMSVNLSE